MACPKQTHSVKNKRSRERKPNFTDVEIRTLLEGVNEHKDTLLFGRNDTLVGRKRRTAIFKQIADRVNEVTKVQFEGVQRSIKEVIKKWAGLKSDALKNRPRGKTKRDSNDKIDLKGNPVPVLVQDIISSKLTKNVVKAESTESVLDNSALGTGTCKCEGVPSYNDTSSCFTTPACTTSSVKQELEESAIPIKSECTCKLDVEDQLPSSADHPGYLKMQNLQSLCRLKPSNKAKTRERKQNFTRREVKILLEVIKKHRDVVLMLGMSVREVKQRRLKWMQILHEYHQKSGLSIRSVSEIRKKWDFLKFKFLKNKEKRDDARAKGLLTLTPESPFAEEVMNILEVGSVVDRCQTKMQEADVTTMMALDASASDSNSGSILHQPVAYSEKLMESTASVISSDSSRMQPDMKRNFTDVEINCLLTEMAKRFKVLSKKLQPGGKKTLKRLKRRHWNMITNKVNACSDNSVMKTRKDVQNAFQALKYAALAENTQESAVLGKTCETKFSFFRNLVLDILKIKSARAGGSYLGPDNKTNNNQVQTVTQECAFPRRNTSTTTDLSEEECNCLVTEIDKFKDVILAASSQDINAIMYRKQCRAWRLVTEKVNKCVIKSFRWTARQLQHKWIELRQGAENYRTNILAGRSQILNKALLDTYLRVMEIVVSSHKTEFTQLEAERQTPHAQLMPSDLNMSLRSSRLQMKAADPKPVTRKHYLPGSSTDDDLSHYLERKRSRNFTDKEIDIMLTVIEANPEVFHSKKKDMDTLSKKHQILQSMVKQLNKCAGQGETERTLIQVKHKLEYLKKEALKWQQTCETGLMEVDDGQPSSEQLDRIVRVMLFAVDDTSKGVTGVDAQTTRNVSKEQNSKVMQEEMNILLDVEDAETSEDIYKEQKDKFTHEEVNIILEVYKANREILNCRTIDKETHDRKMTVFQDIVNRLNSRPGSTQRTVEEVKKKIGNLKTKAYKLLRFKQGEQTEYCQFQAENSFNERILRVMLCDNPSGDGGFETDQEITDDGLEGNKDARIGKERIDTSATFQDGVPSDTTVTQEDSFAETSGTEVMEDHIMDIDDSCPDSDNLTEQLGQSIECEGQLPVTLQENAVNTETCTESLVLPVIQKRQRDRNFTRREVDILLDMYEKNKHILNYGKNDLESTSRKRLVYQQIVDRLSSCSDGKTSRRTLKQVRKKLAELKLEAIKVRQRYHQGEYEKDRLTKRDRAKATAKRVLSLMGVNDGDEKDFGGGEENSRTIQKHLKSLVESCQQLRKLGVDAGAMVFEDSRVMCCGSEQLKLMTTHPQFSHILMNNSAEQNDGQSAEDWTVTLINTSCPDPSLDQVNAQILTKDLAFLQVPAEVLNPESLHVPDEVLKMTQTSSTTYETPAGDKDIHIPAGALNPLQIAHEPLKMPEASSTACEAPSGVKNDLFDNSCTDPVICSSSELAEISACEPLTLTCTTEGDEEESVLEEMDDPSEEILIEDALSALNSTFVSCQGMAGTTTDVMEKLKVMLIKRSSSTKEASPDDHQGNDVNETSNATVQQSSATTTATTTATTSGLSFTCHVCSASFSHVVAFVEHTQNHQEEEKEKESGANRVDRAGQGASNEESCNTGCAKIEREKMKNPVVVLHKLPSSITDGVPDIQQPPSEKKESVASVTETGETEGPIVTGDEEPDAQRPFINRFGVLDSRPRRHVCKFCGQRFLTSTVLKLHTYRHTGERPHHCDECGLTFIQLGSLRYHRITCGSVSKSCKCDICGRWYAHNSSLQYHKRKIHGHGAVKKESQPLKDKYRCDECGRVFLDTFKLRIHKRAHIGDKPFSCDICQKRFSEKCNLQRHAKRHLGIRPYQCEVCGTGFTDKGNLKVHMYYHTGYKPYKCEFCGIAFCTSSQLTVHRRQHTGERPYLCDICGMTFKTGGKLTVHYRQHTGEKPYSCEDCGEMFRERFQLNVHRREHTGVQPYTCPICRKAFDKASHLNVHVRLHTGERPYTCEICGEKFHRSDVLRLHLKKHPTYVPPAKKNPPCSPNSFSEKTSQSTTHLNQDGRKIIRSTPRALALAVKRPVECTEAQQNSTLG